LKGKAVVVVSL